MQKKRARLKETGDSRQITVCVPAHVWKKLQIRIETVMDGQKPSHNNQEKIGSLLEKYEVKLERTEKMQDISEHKNQSQ